MTIRAVNTVPIADVVYDCKYCMNEENLNIIEDKSRAQSVFLFTEWDRIYIEVYDNYSGASYGAKKNINFCPMCGRKLGS